MRFAVVCLCTIVWSALVGSTAHAQPAGNDRPRIAPQRQSMWFYVGQKQILEYRFLRPPFKPYVKQLFSPGGVNVLLDSPEDHKHHHGLMFAIGAAGVDFWAETPECGKQQGNEMSMKNSELLLQMPLVWTDAKNQPILKEDRSVQAEPTPGVTLVTWTSKLSRAGEAASVKLSGSHYFGLGMRFIRSMDKDGTWITPEGKLGEVVRGDEHLTPGKWIAYAAKADGKDVTVAMFDAPGNPRPALWFTMKDPFAYISGTINLWKQPLEMKDPLTFKYGVAVWDGTIAAEQIQKVYEQWLALSGK